MEDEMRQDNNAPANEDLQNSRQSSEPFQNNEQQERNPERPMREGRVMRPRYQRGERAYSSEYNEERRQPRPYRPNYNRDERGYNPNPRPYRNNYQRRPNYDENDNRYPRNNYYPREDGYAPRGGYRQGGYRPNNYGRDNNYHQNNYPRSNYYPREEGYAPRNEYRQEGYRPNNYGRNNGYRPNSYNKYGGRQPRRAPNYTPRAKYAPKKQIEYKEANYDPDEPIRLNKYLSNAGVCSRREADDFITAGVVTVNGEVVKELGTKVKRSDKVMLHDQTINPERKVYILLNKPKNYVTTTDDPQGRKTVMELVKDACKERIYPIGRLDRNTTGVLLFTNDGEIGSKLTHPKYLKKKVYQVTTDQNVTPAHLQQIRDGVELSDGIARADAAEYIDEEHKNQIGIEIHSGKNRIVRRIFEALGYKVTKLDRVSFAGLTKKHLRRGEWRFLNQQEVNMLRMGAFE